MPGFYLLLFALGGLAYLLLEYVWRGRSHWSMGVVGGAAFLLLYAVFTRMGSGLLPLKCVVGALLITAVEFVGGAVINVGLKLHVWDYSARRYHLYGQVCLLYSVLWCFLSLPVALLVEAISSIWG